MPRTRFDARVADIDVILRLMLAAIDTSAAATLFIDFSDA